MVIIMSADSRRSRRCRQFTDPECAVILGLIKSLDPAVLLANLHLFSSQEAVARRTVKKNSTSLDVLNLPELEDSVEGLCIALEHVWADRVEPSANGSAANHLWKWISDLSNYNDKCRIFDGSENGFHSLFLELPWRIFQDWTTGMHAEIDNLGKPAPANSLSWLATKANAMNLHPSRYYKINEILSCIDSWYFSSCLRFKINSSLPVSRRWSLNPPCLETAARDPHPNRLETADSPRLS